MKLITTINAAGLISQLADELVTSYTADNLTITQIVTALLAFQVLTPVITVGTIDPAVSRSISIDGDTILRALYRLRETVGGHIYVDDNRALQWKTTIGEDKGQQIRYQKNLNGIARDIDYTTLANRIYVYGAGEGDARIKLSDIESDLTGDAASGQKDVVVADGSLFEEGIAVTISDDAASEENEIDTIAGNTLTMTTNLANTYTTAANAKVTRGNDYLENTDSQTEWSGIYIKVIVDKSITHPDTLLAWATLRLAELKDPRITYQVNTVDLSESLDVAFSFEALQIGSTVTVIDEDLNIDISAQVVKITHIDLLHPELMEIEVANRTKDISDLLVEVYDTQQLIQHIATTIGAGQVIVKGAFTVKDWVTGGETTIVGSNIETGTITALQIKAETITAAEIDAGTITADRLSFAAFDKGADDLDDVPEGSTYGRVLQTIIAAGLIQVGVGTKDADLDGFHISATEIVGQLGGVDQVVMGTDGKIIAGAGAIILDVDGITIKGTTLNIFDVAAGAIVGNFGSFLGIIYLDALEGYDISFQGGSATNYPRIGFFNSGKLLLRSGTGESVMLQPEGEAEVGVVGKALSYIDVTATKALDTEYQNGTEIRFVQVSFAITVGGDTIATGYAARIGPHTVMDADDNRHWLTVSNPTGAPYGYKYTINLVIPPNYYYELLSWGNTAVIKWIEHDLG